MSKQKIDFSTLPKKVLMKIPLSIRTSGQVHDIDDLPVEIQYLIKTYVDDTVAERPHEDVIDLKPQISVYSDLEPYENLREIVAEYLSNYLSIRLGSYPFDVNFGCALKDQLHTKDTALRNVLIGNEIGLVADAIGGDFDTDITIDNVSVNKTEQSTHTEYSATIELTVNDERFTINTQ